MSDLGSAASRPATLGYDHVFEVLRDNLSDRETATVAELMAAFGPRGYGPVLMLLSLIVISPLGLIPLLPAMIGLLAILLGIGMILGTFAGTGGIWLPHRLGRAKIDAARVLGGIATVEKLTGWLRHVLRERMLWLASGRVGVLLSAAIVILDGAAMGVLGILPLPGVPFVLALPILFLGLGMASRDGLVVSLSLGGAVIGGYIAMDLASRLGSFW